MSPGVIRVPPQLAAPIEIDGQVAAKLMLDLTIYLAGPSEGEFEFLFDLYESICPPGALVQYSIEELPYWALVQRPDLTQSGRAAASAGLRRPYFEPERIRIREGRAFKAAFWDGKPIGDSSGSWSFTCTAVLLRSTGCHAFARMLVPLSSDLGLLRKSARAMIANVSFYSGHGGLVFAYDPWLKEGAFDDIYARARRYWGVDIEDMNETLPLMKEGIKTVSWLTLIGNPLLPFVQGGLSNLAKEPLVTIERFRHGTFLQAGSSPSPGDRNRPDQSLAPYFAVASALRPLFLTHHPDFSGERFVKNGNTVGWIRRFIEPEGWH